jgi:hypothetical protein
MLSLTLREDYGLKVFQNRVERRIFVSKGRNQREGGRFA